MKWRIRKWFVAEVDWKTNFETIWRLTRTLSPNDVDNFTVAVSKAANDNKPNITMWRDSHICEQTAYVKDALIGPTALEVVNPKLPKEAVKGNRYLDYEVIEESLWSNVLPRLWMDLDDAEWTVADSFPLASKNGENSYSEMTDVTTNHIMRRAEKRRMIRAVKKTSASRKWTSWRLIAGKYVILIARGPHCQKRWLTRQQSTTKDLNSDLLPVNYWSLCF